MNQCPGAAVLIVTPFFCPVPVGLGVLTWEPKKFSFPELDLIDRPSDGAAAEPLPPEMHAGDAMLDRALGRARWTILWERAWPPLATIATAVGLFLALSWLGLWLWLPPIARAIGLGVFFLLTAAGDRAAAAAGANAKQGRWPAAA